MIRLGFALLTVFGGLGVLLYLCAWVVVPDETDGVSIAESIVGNVGRDSASFLLRAQYGRMQSSLCRFGVCALCCGSPPAG